MRLIELFDNSMDISQRLRQAALDIITPLLAHQVPFITVQSVIDQLRQSRPGIVIDRSLIMSILNPDEVEAVSKIEGDRIYLGNSSATDFNKSDKDEAENNIQKVKDAAIKQAQKNVKTDSSTNASKVS